VVVAKVQVMTAWRARVGLAIRIAIASAIIWWIIREAGAREIAEAFRHANVTVLVVAFCFLTLETLTKAWNWLRILDSLGYATHGGRLRLLHASLVAAFMGSLLPSTASTDALRAEVLPRAAVIDVASLIAQTLVQAAARYSAFRGCVARFRAGARTLCS
jgi:hypothetical protein